MDENKNNDVILSVRDLVVKFNLRGQVLTAIRGISMLMSHWVGMP